MHLICSLVAAFTPALCAAEALLHTRRLFQSPVVTEYQQQHVGHMKQPTESQIAPDLPPLRILAGSAVGIALAHGAAAQSSPAQTPADAAVQLPPIAVAEQDGQSRYQSAIPALPKLTQPLPDIPQSITVIPRQLMEDQQTTAVRDALRNIAGISLAAGEAGSQGDNLTLRGFAARNDFYFDGMPTSAAITATRSTWRYRGAEGPCLDPVWARLHRRHDQPGEQAATACTGHRRDRDRQDRPHVPLSWERCSADSAIRRLWRRSMRSGLNSCTPSLTTLQQMSRAPRSRGAMVLPTPAGSKWHIAAIFRETPKETVRRRLR